MFIYEVNVYITIPVSIPVPWMLWGLNTMILLLFFLGEAHFFGAEARRGASSAELTPTDSLRSRS